MLENSRVEAPFPGDAVAEEVPVLLLDAVLVWRRELRADVSAAAFDVADAFSDTWLPVVAAAAASEVESCCGALVVVGEELSTVVAFVDAARIVASLASVGIGPVSRLPFWPSASTKSPVRMLAVEPSASRKSPVLFVR